MADFKKRETAHKIKIGDILRGTPIVEDLVQEIPSSSEPPADPVTKERFRFLELDDKKIIRVNVIGNVIDNFNSEGEKKFATLTIDDASGQIRLKVFGEDSKKFEELSLGDTIITIGLLRSFNKEVYIYPEIIKKADPRYLLVRKLELEGSSKLLQESKTENSPEASLSSQIISIIKGTDDFSGVSTEDIILKINSASPEAINSEIIKLIENGVVYEPRPGRVRWLG